MIATTTSSFEHLEQSGSGDLQEHSMPSPILLKVPQVAFLLSLSRAEIYRLIDREALPVHRFGRAVRIASRELEDWLERRRHTPVR